MNAVLNAVETRGLGKRYQDLVAVDDLDMEVRHGEVYGFLGPNGAGKTTTLRMLLGLIRPSTGTVRLLGRPAGRGALDGVGALIEGPSFYPYLSGRRNLQVMAAHAGVDRSRVVEALETVELSGRADDRYGTYSLGMKQRLGLAAALLKRPRLLILDEPTNGLDPAGMADMRGTIRELAAGGCTVLLSSHMLGEVEQICDRVGVIARGRLLTEVTVSELHDQRRLCIVATPAEHARSVVEARLGQARVRTTDVGLEADVSMQDAPQINRALVDAGVDVHELRWTEASLEQTFLDLTGDDPHAA